MLALALIKCYFQQTIIIQHWAFKEIWSMITEYLKESNSHYCSNHHEL